MNLELKQKQNYTHVFAWKNNPVRQKYYGMLCRIKHHNPLKSTAKMRSCCIEFENGDIMITSILALRKFPVRQK